MQTNNNRPRIFNGQSEQDKLLVLEAKKKRRVKEIHRVRRNRILAIFAVVIGILLVQIVTVKVKTAQINQDVRASKVQYHKTAAENTKLKTKVNQLNDETYVGKLIRYKYFYSKPGETIYNLPVHEPELQNNDR